MAVALRQSRSFDSASPVTRYWLANCVGFSVTGGEHGTVERILSEGDPHAPELLVVRSGRHRVKRLPTSTVVAVVPSDRVLVVAKRPSVAAARARLTAHLAGRVTARGGVLGVRLVALLAVRGWRVSRRGWVLTRRGWVLTRRGWVVASPHAARLAREGGTHTARFARGGGTQAVRLVRSVPWQRFGPSVRSATTRTWQGRSPLSSLRRSTSSTTSSGSVSED